MKTHFKVANVNKKSLCGENVSEGETAEFRAFISQMPYIANDDIGWHYCDKCLGQMLLASIRVEVPDKVASSTGAKYAHAMKSLQVGVNRSLLA